MLDKKNYSFLHITIKYSFIYFVYFLVQKNIFAEIIELPEAKNQESTSHFIYPKNLIIDKRSNTTKIFSNLNSLISEGAFILDRRKNIQNKDISFWPKYTTPNSFKFRKLIVFFHGLASSPGAWENHIKWLESNTKNIDIYAPYLEAGGNTELTKILSPLEKILKNYIKKTSDHSICFLGTSNGARVSMHLEYKLRSMESNIFISSVAGVFFGTKRIFLRYMITHPSVYHELSYANTSAKELILNARNVLNHRVERKFDFYASFEDNQVIPYHSSLPIIKQKESFFLVTNSNHNHIVGEVLKHQLERCLRWLNR